MFFLGLLAPTITSANVVDDVLKILSGVTTTTAGLSSSFVGSSSTFVNTLAPGWTIYDSAAGAVSNGFTPKIIRAPWSDAGAKYKNIYVDSKTNNQMTLNGWHTWDSTAHAGTLPHVTTPLAASWQSVNFAANGYLMVSASTNHFQIIAFTNSSFATGDSFGCYEFTREDKWMTVALDYPNWFTVGDNSVGGPVSATYSNVAMSKVLQQDTMLDTAPFLASSYGMLVSPPSMRALGAISTPGYSGINASQLVDAFAASAGTNAAKSATSYATPISLRATKDQSAFVGGSTYGKQSCVFLFRNIWAGGDTVVVASITYFVAYAGTRALLIAKQ